jgi:hypothetical protein
MDYQEPEPDVGIEGCYVCTNEKCGYVVDLEEEDYSDE